MARFRNVVVGFALLLAVLLPLWFLVAALGVKFGLFDYRVGFGLMTSRLGSQLIYAALAAGALAVVLALLVRPRRGLAMALIAVLIPALAVGYGRYARAQSKGLPAIHDVMTDPAAPPPFSAALVKVRTDSKSNPILPPDMPMKERPQFARMQAARPDIAARIADKSVAQLVAAGFPDVRPIALQIPPQRAFDLAREEAEAQGWKIHSTDARSGLIDATAETFWFGFKDDVAIRVKPGAAAGTSVVDLRSISRVGGGDMGANGKRIRAFTQALRRRAAAAA